jgi:hypothetical protein
MDYSKTDCGLCQAEEEQEEGTGARRDGGQDDWQDRLEIASSFLLANRRRGEGKCRAAGRRREMYLKQRKRPPEGAAFCVTWLTVS